MCQRLNNELPNNNGTDILDLKKKKVLNMTILLRMMLHENWKSPKSEGMTRTQYDLYSVNAAGLIIMSSLQATQSANKDWTVFLKLLGLKYHMQEHLSDSWIEIINHWATLVPSIRIYPLRL